MFLTLGGTIEECMSNSSMSIFQQGPCRLPPSTMPQTAASPSHEIVDSHSTQRSVAVPKMCTAIIPGEQASNTPWITDDVTDISSYVLIPMAAPNDVLHANHPDSNYGRNDDRAVFSVEVTCVSTMSVIEKMM